MKANIYITLFLLCSFTTKSQNSISTTTSFNGFHCDGKPGICDIDSQENRLQANTFIVLNQNNTLTFIVNRQKLSDTEQRQVLGVNPTNIDKKRTYYFKVPYAYTLPNTIKEALNASTIQLILREGSYPIEITEDSYKITFTLH